MKKNLARILSAAVLSAGLFFTPAKKTDAGEFYLFGNLVYGPKTDVTRTAQVDSVPEYIRDVPAHSDDLWKVNPSDVAPISDSSFNFSTASNELLNLNLDIGAGYRDDIFDFKIGPRLGYSFGRSITPSDAWVFDIPVKERNYTNHPGTEDRSVGAALTYYGCNFESFPLSIGASTRASLAFDISEGNEIFFIKPFIEYSAMYSPSHFVIENGWDRYGGLETKDTFNLTNGSINHSIEGGIGFSAPGFSVEIFSAIDIPQVLTTSLGNETGFRYDSTANISVGIRTGFSIDSLIFN
ncbi:MAG: hypothetical protein M1416_01870 [Candidatus Pacearchaeota archaeon]|nr:hypothetical protein [Candidatus Pacearchaeota archaeon]